MKIKHLIFIALSTFIFFNLEAKHNPKGLVVSTVKINLEEFPQAWNPSIIKTDFGFLLTFRHCLAPHYPWISYIGIVKLDHDLNIISKPQLLNTRDDGSSFPSQTEDARIFTFNNKIYLIYNDNPEVVNPSSIDRRDIYLTELIWKNDEFVLGTPLKLMHETKYEDCKWQKNWVPFVYEKQLLMSYSISPHEVLKIDTSSGLSKHLFTKRSGITWDKGVLRGGTPALLVDGNYLGFFHSSIVTKSETSNGNPMHHYYMGAYIFSSKPPFRVQKISPEPIVADGFYTHSSYDKRVIFPGGFAVVGDQFYVAYGKDDSEVWIAIIDKKKLMKSLKSTK